MIWLVSDLSRLLHAKVFTFLKVVWICQKMKREKEESTLHQFQRNKYFYGKLMTVRDFELEQEYFNGKRYLLNRLIHGKGLLYGFSDLELSPGGSDEVQISGSGMGA